MRCIALASFAVAVLLVAVANAAPLNDLSIFKYNPVANAAAVVTSGNARFTVLTDGVIRMEYSATGTFEDRATLAFVNRNLPVPSFTQSTNNGELTIKTNTITLTYRTGNPFSISSLWVSTIGGAVWNYGDYDNGNLFGTIKSLDELCNPTLNCTQNANWRVHSESLHCAFGVATTGGWTTVDDTKNYIMSSVDGQWFNDGLRSSSDVDTYFFGHGKNFKQAIFDYVQLSGKAPLPTKNLLGSWYTRWFDFDNDDLVRLLDTYSRNDLPLDVLILDMNWHMKNDWTGYSFDRTLYPVPEDTIDMVHSRGLVIGANLHDADGFGYWEDEYATMARISGINPASMMAVPFAPLNATYMHTMEDQVLKKLGFDIWWIDWQQGGNYGGCDGYQMNPTILTNHVRSTDAIRRGDNVRANILARWGGLGTHRYPVGFSGDVSQLSWTCFEYQPYFVATAANVAYGYISNDLVGPSGDHELHVRWMQFGAFSPIMRIHDRGMSSGSCMADDSCAIVNIWDLEYDHVEAIRMAMKQRNSLLPYTYTMSRNTFDNGLAMVHPMYYDFPNEANAYDITANSGAQYMFGDDMFVAPITKQSQQAYHMIAKNVWIPPGTWYDDVFGALVTGPTTMTLQYTLYDVPLFIRAGAVIPRIPNPSTMGVAGTTFAAVDWYVYPGATQGSGRMYEDDGVSYDYVRGVFGWTTATYSTSGLTTTVTIGATNGTFTGQPATRNYRIVLVGVLPLSQATVNSVAAPYVRFPTLGQLSWTYDGATGSVIIDCGSQSTSQQVSVSVTYGAQDASQSLTTKLKVFARRSMLGKRVVDNWQQTPFSQNAGPGFTKQLAARAGYISAVAGTNVSLAMTLMSSYPLLVNDAIQELGGYPGPTQAPQYNDRILLQLFDFTRQDMLLCGSWECVQTNTNYQVMWADGFQPNPSDNCAVGFYDYFSYSDVDNWATTQSTPPSGYAAATFGNGNVLSCGGADRRCIDVYWNPTTTDHLTTSNPMGAQWAADHGYSKVNSCIGYAYVNDTAAPQSMDELRAYVAKIRARGTPFDSAIRGNQRPHEEKKKHHHHGKQLKAADPQPPGDNSAVQIALALLQSMGAY